MEGIIKISAKEYYTDPLTGAYNRNYLIKEMDSYLDKEIYVSFIDSNDLKKINDTQGHIAGDKHLKEIVNVLKKHGKVFRYGGDEFILISNDEPIELKRQDAFTIGTTFKGYGKHLEEAIEYADNEMLVNKLLIKSQVNGQHVENYVRIRRESCGVCRDEVVWFTTNNSPDIEQGDLNMCRVCPECGRKLNEKVFI